MLTQHGAYYFHLTRWLTYFKRSQIMILNFEAVSNPATQRDALLKIAAFVLDKDVKHVEEHYRHLMPPGVEPFELEQRNSFTWCTVRTGLAGPFLAFSCCGRGCRSKWGILGPDASRSCANGPGLFGGAANCANFLPDPRGQAPSGKCPMAAHASSESERTARMHAPMLQVASGSMPDDGRMMLACLVGAGL
eukprot:scaffold359_cov313-Prasinococcus_capsulatus_cf.AAC.4